MASEMTVTASTIIHRPLIEVYDRVCDMQRAKDWVPFCESCQLDTRSTAPNMHNGVGPGMKARFSFGISAILTVDIVQEVTEFEWGRRLRFTTSRSDANGGGLSGLVSPLISRSALLFTFEPAQSGTVLTIEVAIWMAYLGLAELSRPKATDLLLQSLQRLKRVLETTEPLRFDPWIFFNYRRADTAFACDRIYDSLRREFGEGALYRDVYHVRGGADLEGSVREAIKKTPVFLVLIGEQWTKGFKNVQSPTDGRDWVKDEISMAIEANAAVIPLLIGEAKMPTGMEVPPEVSALLRYNALPVRREPDFPADIRKVIETLWEVRRSPAKSEPTPIGEIIQDNNRSVGGKQRARNGRPASRNARHGARG